MPSRHQLPQGTTTFHRSPHLPGVEVRTSRYMRVGFASHSHAGYAVALVEHGHSRATLRTTATSVRAGDVVLLHPHDAHACNPDPDHPWAYRMFHFDESLLPEEPGFARPVIQNAPLASALRHLATALTGTKDALTCDCTLQSVLNELHRMADGTRTAQTCTSSVREVREMLHDRWNEPVRLTELANAVDRSPHAVLRSFRRATGLTPHDYQHGLRTQRARILLANGMDIAQVAATTGYADQAAFTHAFRRRTGTTPGVYRKPL